MAEVRGVEAGIAATEKRVGATRPPAAPGRRKRPPRR
jgi:hypothetical protein